MAAEYAISPSRHGFSIMYRGKPSRWSMSIESMVSRHKRTKVEHYYILIMKNGNIVDRFYINGGKVESVTHNAIPNYVRLIAESVLSSRDLNQFVIGKKINNMFTKMKAKN